MRRGSTNGEDSAALLRALRDDASPVVRAEAALSLAFSSGEGADVDSITNALLKTATTDREMPRRAAVLALGERLDTSAADELVALLPLAPALWREIAWALAGHRSAEITMRLENLLDSADDPRSRQGAARALGLQAVGGLTNRGGVSRDSSPKVSPDRAFDDHPIFGYEDAAGNLHPCA